MHSQDTINTVAAQILATKECQKTQLPLRRKNVFGGQTTVEFALILVPFFAILFAIVDFAQIYFYENSCQNALREACRFATSGRVIQQLDASGNPVYEVTNGVTVPKAIMVGSKEASRNQCIKFWFLSNCILANFPTNNIVITSAPTLPGVPPVVSTNSLGYLTLLSGYNVTTNNGTISTNAVAAVPGPGNYNDYVQITATFHLNTITPLAAAYGGGYSRQGWSTFPIHVSAIVKNEPALLNFQHVAIYDGEP